ncbi:peroxisomal membrane protein pex16 [Phanerochaete sordida]|uniref:Peroxisomal membrane protein PEX16 n=1 Tax=Phanerochaete sordida TaxID=48140 RepID=A0A9P3G143_9APHY|nr:peroxisomal membrane protein pex16 [Phanerochaete sordida]
MSSALAHYESFLVNNVSVISTLESSLRSITWILPGRFKDAELASEALSALLNVTSLYHDTLLSKVVKSEPKLRQLVAPSLHARYTRAWCEKDARYKWAARTLELIKFVQLLVEMGLRRRVSSKARWRGIVFIEVIKAVLRFMLLRITRRPLLSPPIPERDFDPSMLPDNLSETSSPTLAPSSPPDSVPSTPDHLRNNRVPLPPHPLIVQPPPPTSTTKDAVDEYLLSKALLPTAVKAPTALVKALVGPTAWLAEIVYILRPLIYAIMLARDSGRNTKRPLITALALEFVARQLRRTPSTGATLERSEYSRRDSDIAWYLLRGSIWEGWTRPKLDAIAERTASLPVIGVMSAFVKDWIPLIDEYHYYTAP